VSGATETQACEPILDPDLPIIDAHHHLWYHPEATAGEGPAPGDNEVGPLLQNYRRHPRYLFDELLADATSGHAVRATVYVEVHSMYRRKGPPALRSVGEVEFANGVAAMSASGAFGDVELCAGIVGGADLRLGDVVSDVLEAHIVAGGGRYRGVRAGNTAYDAKLPRLMELMHSAPEILSDASFRDGFARLAPLGLSCDLFLFESQLPEIVGLAQRFPETQIILNHVGMPVGLGCYAGGHAERFPVWRESLRQAARCPNIALKVGGLGNAMCGFPSLGSPDAVGSAELAEQWRPYVETSIEAFGVDRCMFESNFPVDGVTARYPVVWNAFKRIVRSASAAEKAALFFGTAAKIYRLDVCARV
jgi:predicted TIM-barrel fold metal-dependent hydrolase